MLDTVLLARDKYLVRPYLLPVFSQRLKADPLPLIIGSRRVDVPRHRRTLLRSDRRSGVQGGED